ncbi:hypothetical protein DFO67_10297 [Modicisalibacter xianhensis]|uniref:Uncharacterized protein n=1 Tax=Modicisalibacter xianhensis TaxID=442341 RepID=A0A4R8G7G0_9GAMM|nr:hypothetical protein [Halomonas xianhensis]TDX32148.1 hypothetical protein DFO67_10297 [Halomonas xianhensis]
MKIVRVKYTEAPTVGTDSTSGKPTVHRIIDDIQRDEHGRVKRAPVSEYLAAARRSREERRQFILKQRKEILEGK